MKDLNPQFNST